MYPFALRLRITTRPTGNHQLTVNATAAVVAGRMRIRCARAFNLWRIV